MKKVGIVTICDFQNFGNRLQNYAVQEILTSLNILPESIINYPAPSKNVNKITLRDYLKKSKKIFQRETPRKIILKLSALIFSKRYKKNKSYKRRLFEAWTDQHIKKSEYQILKGEVPIGLVSNYNYFLVGSDQVWNPFFRNGSPVDFLRFAPKEKRIAYAPSFGVSSIPPEFIADYKYWLSDFNTISVREESGAVIVKELTGKEAVVTIDPTLLLPKDKWLMISKASEKKPKINYVLTYFISGINNDNKKIINLFSKERNFRIINLAKYNLFESDIVSPSEFIDYFRSAQIVFTDSFHGTIFSIIFEKNFYVFDRIDDKGSMNSRVDTLLKKFNLENRKWSNAISLCDYNDIDYSSIGEVIQRERDIAYNFLSKALKT